MFSPPSAAVDTSFTSNPDGEWISPRDLTVTLQEISHSKKISLKNTTCTSPEMKCASIEAEMKFASIHDSGAVLKSMPCSSSQSNSKSFYDMLYDISINYVTSLSH